MALGRCDSCNERLGIGSATCRRCGAKKKRIKAIFGAIILAQVGTIVWYEYFHVKAHGFGFVAAGPDLFKIPAIDKTPPAGWLYFQTTDDLVHDVTRHARVQSRGAAPSRDAHDTSTTGVMELRASNIYGRSALLTLNRQAFDTVDETCSLHVQFDAGPAMEVPANCSAESTYATIVVQNARDLIDRIGAAHNLSIDAKLSAKTTRTALFEVGDLKL